MDMLTCGTHHNLCIRADPPAWPQAPILEWLLALAPQRGARPLCGGTVSTGYHMGPSVRGCPALAAALSPSALAERLYLGAIPAVCH